MASAHRRHTKPLRLPTLTNTTTTAGVGAGVGAGASSFSVFGMRRCSRGLTVDRGCNAGGDGGAAATAEDGDGQEATARMAAAATYNFIQHYLSLHGTLIHLHLYNECQTFVHSHPQEASTSSEGSLSTSTAILVLAAAAVAVAMFI